MDSSDAEELRRKLAEQHIDWHPLRKPDDPESWFPSSALIAAHEEIIRLREVERIEREYQEKRYPSLPERVGFRQRIVNNLALHLLMLVELHRTLGMLSGARRLLDKVVDVCRDAVATDRNRYLPLLARLFAYSAELHLAEQETKAALHDARRSLATWRELPNSNLRNVSDVEVAEELLARAENAATPPSGTGS